MCVRLKLKNLRIYTGDGKGKTTASIGDGISVLGSGKKVCMIQFLKDDSSSEVSVLKNLENFDLYHFESKKNFFYLLDDEKKLLLKKETDNALKFFKKLISEKNYDLIILDEIINSINNKIIDLEDFISILKTKDSDTEVILTGRDPSDKLIELAQFTNIFNLVKHPFEKNIGARKGIEY